MKDIRSARLLLKAVRNLEASLLEPYEVHPESPETDFLDAVTRVAFFSRIVFKDLVTREGADICASSALSTAIAIGEFDAAVRFLKIEIADMKNDAARLTQLRKSTETALEAHGRTDRWNRLLALVDEAI